MSGVAAGSPTEGQRDALAAVRSFAQASGGALTVDLDCRELSIYLIVRVHLATASLLSSEKGIKLQDWEPIDILIPDEFPRTPPIAWGREDFPGLPHQAEGSRFCVRVEEHNWDFSAGMPGFLRAVIDTYEHITLGTLHGYLQPWRPWPVDRYVGKGCAVIRADVPTTGRAVTESWRQWAIGSQVSQNRIDIIEWLDIVHDAGTATDLTQVLSAELARVRTNREAPEAFLIPAVIIAKPVALEYEQFWLDLMERLEEHGIDRTSFLAHLAQPTAIGQPSSDGEAPAAVLFRVAADTESAVADTDPTAKDGWPAAGGRAARFAVARLTKRDVRRFVIAQAAQGRAASPRRFMVASVPWIRVYDGRRESLLTRAAGRPTEKLTGKKILLLGCGGLGAPIAEHCVRSGAARLHIVDSGTISPGVLSRQPYEDADVGQPKAEVLAPRLDRIQPESEVTGTVADLLSADFFDGLNLGQYDLVIDATANRSVAAKIERLQRDRHDHWPALITVAISQQATHGVAAVTPKGTIGAGVDLLRRLGLRTCESTALSDVYAAFFPPEASRLNFRPDTSCSDTTFIGSSTDISALAAQLLRSAVANVGLSSGATGNGPPHRSLSIIRLGNDDELKAAVVALDLPPDRVVIDHEQAYEVRIDETAMETIRGWVRASVNGRTGGAGLTGGLLLGQFDSACRVAWVSRATGLPSESTATPLDINLDTDQVHEFLEDCRSRSGGMQSLIGFWHTHLGGSAAPSPADVAYVRRAAAALEWRSPSALLLELTVPEDRSVGEAGSPWLPEIHAEAFAAGPDPTPAR